MDRMDGNLNPRSRTRKLTGKPWRKHIAPASVLSQARGHQDQLRPLGLIAPPIGFNKPPHQSETPPGRFNKLPNRAEPVARSDLRYLPFPGGLLALLLPGISVVAFQGIMVDYGTCQ